MRPVALSLALLVSVVASATQARAACTPPDCALAFGSANATVTFGNPTALGLSTFTLETWFRRDGPGTTASTGTGGIAAFLPLVTKGAAQADGSNVDANYLLGINTAGNVIAADFEEGAGGASPGLNHPISGVTPIVDGVWYHAAATYDGTTWKLYLNGVLESELVVGQPVRSDSIQHAGLATTLSSTGTPSGFFDGALDEVRIWSTVRTQAQIQAAINQEIASDADLVARWGLNEGSGTSVGDSSGAAQDGSIVGTGWSWVAGSPFSVNVPPSAPGLVAPPDAATGVATAPSLEVSVSDPDGDPMTVRFFGREVVAAPPDFTVVALPDTQYYASSLNGGSPAIMNAQSQWIVDEKASRNIRYVAQLGDCVEHGNNGGDDVEWQNADAAFDLIEDPLTTLLPDGIPYGIGVGNHDQSPIGDADGTPPGSSTTSYNQFFGEARFLGRSYYGGHYGSDNDNHFDLFSAGGMDFIVITLEYDTSPDAAVLAWADALLQLYSERRAIVTSHWIVNTGTQGSFSAQGQAIYDALKANSNLFLMLSGHVCSEGRRQDTFNGNTVYSLLSDYQCDPAGGNGWLRILTFSPAQNEIQVQTYSPWLDQFRTGGSSEFTIPYDMSGAGFGLIAENAGVPSASTTSASWTGLAPGATYEWYASADDGKSPATPGPVWSFMTAGQPIPAIPPLAELLLAAALLAAAVFAVGSLRGDRRAG